MPTLLRQQRGIRKVTMCITTWEHLQIIMPTSCLDRLRIWPVAGTVNNVLMDEVARLAVVECHFRELRIIGDTTESFPRIIKASYSPTNGALRRDDCRSLFRWRRSLGLNVSDRPDVRVICPEPGSISRSLRHRRHDGMASVLWTSSRWPMHACSTLRALAIVVQSQLLHFVLVNAHPGTHQVAGGANWPD